MSKLLETYRLIRHLVSGNFGKVEISLLATLTIGGISFVASILALLPLSDFGILIGMVAGLVGVILLTTSFAVIDLKREKPRR